MLTPLAENMVRYATLNHVEFPAVIRVKVAEGLLTITAENHIRISEGRRGSGTGLTNLRERLRFVYPGQYNLSTHAYNDCFYVTLKIPGVSQGEPNCDCRR